jgi:hypothetical protein
MAARRSGLARIGAVLVAAASVLLAGAGPAAAQPVPPAGLDDVLAALGVDKAPTDFVVMVDLSRSMADNGRYADVKAALRDLFGRLDPVDRVSLVTFAEVPTVVARAGPQAARGAVDRLPVTPDGAATDIGAAIEEGFALLERSPADRSAALLLLTDGLPQPPAYSKYAALDGPAWSALAGRGQLLAQRVHGIALPLGTGETGAPLLGRTLPGTVVLQLQGDDLADYLAGLPRELRLAAARERVEKDLAGSVTARWISPPGVPDLGTGPATMAVELRSTTAVLPLVLDGLQVEATAPDVAATGVPPAVVLPPGGVERLTLRLADDSPPAGWHLGRSSKVVAGDLHLTGRVGTPWRLVVEQDLRQHLNLRPLDTVAPLTVAVSAGLSWWLVGSAAAAVPALLLLAWLLWNRSRPRLTGTLTVDRPDDIMSEIDVAGRRTVRFHRLDAPAPDEMNGTYVVRGARRGPPVVVYRPDRGPAQRRSCSPGEWVDIGGVLLRWTDRARV